MIAVWCEAGRCGDWAKKSKSFSIMTGQPIFKESALPLSDLFGTTCQALIPTSDETNHRAGPVPFAHLAHDLVTRRPGERLP